MYDFYATVDTIKNLSKCHGFLVLPSEVNNEGPASNYGLLRLVGPTPLPTRSVYKE